MPQSLACVYVHVIFSTKNRAAAITTDLQPRLYAYFGGILRDRRAVLTAAGGTADHVHLLISLGRELSIAEAVRLLKANSSKWIHETFRGHQAFAWQSGYGAFSVSHSNVGQVTKYLEQQAEHHRTLSFQDELRQFLRRHEIEFDERYVWD